MCGGGGGEGGGGELQMQADRESPKNGKRGGYTHTHAMGI